MLLLYFTIACHVLKGFGQEPLCNKFSFQEHLLDKMVRVEFKVETMFNEMARTQSDIQSIAAKVENELHTTWKERERIKNEVTTHKSDVSRKLTDAAKRMEFAIKDFEAKIGRFSRDLLEFQNNTSANKGLSVTYIRWGRTVCPKTSKVLYEGYASGSHYDHAGGTIDTLCLPNEPQFGKSHIGEQGNYLYNSEYQASGEQQSSIFGENLHNEDVPCVMCQTDEKVTVLIVPARMECHEGWQLEYSGYLMMTHQTHKARTGLKCVDANPEKVKGQGGNNNGNLFYFVESGGTLPDPPYTRGRELTCAVCTK